MSSIHAQARAREQAAKEFVDRTFFKADWRNDTAHAMLVSAFIGGGDHAEAHCATVHREEQDLWHERWNEVGGLVQEAVALFRSYEKHHRSEAFRLHAGSDQHRDRMAKSDRNRVMAEKLERWLGGDQAPAKVWDGRSSTLENEMALGVAEYVAEYARRNPADALRAIAETMVDGETIKGVDHASFDRAAAICDAEVTVNGLFPGDDGYRRAEAAGLHPEVVEALRVSVTETDNEPTKEA